MLFIVIDLYHPRAFFRKNSRRESTICASLLLPYIFCVKLVTPAEGYISSTTVLPRGDRSGHQA